MKGPVHFALGSVLLFLAVSSASAAPPPEASGAPAGTVEAGTPSPGTGTIVLNFGDQIDIRLLVDYVAARTKVNFIYDESLTGVVSMRTPREVPADALYTILESVLEFKGWGWSLRRRGSSRWCRPRWPGRGSRRCILRRRAGGCRTAT